MFQGYKRKAVMNAQALRPYRQIDRRKCRKIHVGSVPVGGDAPISVQTMTNTPTTDVKATLAQIEAAAQAGADIVRVSCPDEDSSAALKEICKFSPVPIIADIHFHYRRALEAADAGAACLRINPGNIGNQERVAEVVRAARDNGCSMRIGVNGGSLEKHLLEKYAEPCPEALVESALEHACHLQDLDFHEFKISVKASDVFLAGAAPIFKAVGFFGYHIRACAKWATKYICKLKNRRRYFSIAKLCCPLLGAIYYMIMSGLFGGKQIAGATNWLNGLHRHYS
jgi:hypothetical protein